MTLWTNPFTKQSATLPLGWDLTTSGEDGDEMLQFASDDESAVVNFYQIGEPDHDVRDIMDVDIEYFRNAGSSIFKSDGWHGLEFSGIDCAIKTGINNNKIKSSIITWFSQNRVWQILILSQSDTTIDNKTKPIVEDIIKTTSIP